MYFTCSSERSLTARSVSAGIITITACASGKFRIFTPNFTFEMYLSNHLSCPPPVVQAMRRIDPKLRPYVGPEATVTLAGTVILSWLVLILLRSCSVLNSRRSAIADDDEDGQGLTGSSKSKSAAAGSAEAQYDATVLLCGPRSGGKTALFYQLGFGLQDMPTVTSIKANVAISRNRPLATAATSSSTSGEESANSNYLPRIRYVDWPGHAPLDDTVLKQSVLNKPSTTRKANSENSSLLRIVLVLDATQPVATAAESL